MNKVARILVLCAIMLVQCVGEPDVIVEGCCTDSYFNFKNERGDPTATPRYWLIIDGESYLVDGITYIWSKEVIPRKIRLSYWINEDGEGWDLQAYQIGYCEEQ